MIHFPNTPIEKYKIENGLDLWRDFPIISRISPVTHWAVMSSLRLDGTAFLAFKNDLSLLEAHLLDHLFGGIASWDSSL